MKLHLPCFLGLAIVAVASSACDGPRECVDGPSNLTPDVIAQCDPPPDGAAIEDEIVSAGAETEPDGTLVITWSSFGLECGTSTDDISLWLPDDCWRQGWVLTAEIPAELAYAGSVIEMHEHPEVVGDLAAFSQFGSGGVGIDGDEPFFTGRLELVALSDACVTGVMTGFGTGSLDVVLGGPELDGAFVAPRCGNVHLESRPRAHSRRGVSTPASYLDED